ncbi:HWE histidine kinase domain-containing protein [Phreatobacter sp. AB_2022a]|uniref:HWE histidine kinase domain-containing protein n=1 Tax=Phreatobacter sp. AB_2022a TaxID=3003134 RepID=UPI0022874BA8|nr:HWE histidine kinase domain-containing protein [Phreatobacter sp. AB_2022a]MCZ0734172.1 PAS domain S-box protein [Phreatobacter sp. AB_2022a]
MPGGLQLLAVDVLMTDELRRRPSKPANRQAEAEAFRELSGLIARNPKRAISRFMDIAVRLCRAGSAGLSLIDENDAGEEELVWAAIAGALKGHLGQTMPRRASPCSLGIEAGRIVLVGRPERAFPAFAAITPPVVEELVVPLLDSGGLALGALWIAHHDADSTFDAEDARIMEHLAIQLVLALKLRDRLERKVGAHRANVALRAANIELAETSAFLQSVLDSSTDCIMVLSLAGKIELVNSGGLALMEADDLVGRCWPTLWGLGSGDGGDNDAGAAVRIAAAGGVSRFQGFSPTARGAPKWWDVAVTPIIGEFGRPLRLLVVSRDISGVKAAEERLAASERRLRVAQNFAEVGTFEWSIDSNIVYPSEQFCRLWGIAPQAAMPGEVFADHIHPDDRHLLLARRDGPIESAGDYVEYRVIRGEEVRWLARRGDVLRDADGRPTSVFGACFDVTDRRKAEEQQRLLMQELTHRVKNTMAMVQAIGLQTLRSAHSVEAAGAAFAARMQALSAAHDVLIHSNWSSTSLKPLIERAVRLHDDTGRRFLLDGPALILGPRAALTLALTLHELGTNALKYGALSNDQGRVELTWRVEDAGSDRRVVMTWREIDGPIVPQPTVQGFGSRLIRLGFGVPSGKAELVFTETGVVWTASASLAEIRFQGED